VPLDAARVAARKREKRAEVLCGKLNYPLPVCGSVLFDLWSCVCVCELKTGPHSTAALMQARPRGGALMHAGCDSRNLCGFGIFCACSRVF
jgi:hypothetical protein